MPGPIVHLFVKDQLAGYLDQLNKADYSKLLAYDQCSPYSSFGSIGPDFLFFSLREYGDTAADFFNLLFKLFEVIKPFVELYEKTVKPINDEIDKIENWFDEKFLHGLIQQFRDTVSTIMEAALLAIPAESTKWIDYFLAFEPKIQLGAKEEEWYWFDFLHYRRTGDFCSKMWSLAKNDDDLKRYCLGYASHIGTDVVGHPFVNAVVGGPYRMHWHRHKLVENWIDAYSLNYYNDYFIKSLGNCSRLEKNRYFNGSISGSNLYKMCEFNEGKLPKKLSNMFISALNSTFQDVPHPRKMNEDDLDTTYQLWLLWFKKATELGSAVKPDHVDPPGEKTSSLVKDFLKGFPSFPSNGGGGKGRGGGKFSLKKMFEEIRKFLEYLLDVFKYIADWLADNLIEILTIGYWEAVQFFKWVMYQAHKAAYEFYDNFRFMLVLGGYLFPERDDLDKTPWGNAFINTSFVDLTKGGRADFMNYPIKQEHHSVFSTEHHFVYPETFVEQPLTESAPNTFYGKFPDYFISKAQKKPDSIIDKIYDCSAPYGDGDQFTHFLDQATWDTDQLGNAITCSGDLIAKRMANLPNFNLDGDRGYGWKTWRADNPGQIDDISTVNVTYID